MIRLAFIGRYNKITIVFHNIRYLLLLIMLFGFSCFSIKRAFALDIIVIEPISSSRVINVASADRTGEEELQITVARNEYL